VVELNGPSGWLSVNTTGLSTITHLWGNIHPLPVSVNVGGIVTQPETLLGQIIFESSALGGQSDTLEVEVIVADTVIIPSDSPTDIEDNIEMVFDSAHIWDDGRTFEVIGFYADTAADLLVSDMGWYLKNEMMPAKTALLLTGPHLPGDYFYSPVELTGKIDSVRENPYPYYPGVDTILIYFKVTGYAPVSEYNDYMLSPIDDPVDIPLPPEIDKSVKGPCDFAILLSGGVSQFGNRPRYWNLLKANYSLLRWMGYPEDNIYVIYYEGLPEEAAPIPAGRIYRATQANIDFAFTSIINDLNNNCTGQESSFYMMTFNHGAANGDICLLGNNGMSPATVRTRVQSVIDAGCDNIYVTMGQCFSGQPALELKNCNTGDDVKMYVTSDANENVSSWSRPPGDVYLEEMVAQLYMNTNFEKSMIEACEEYYDYLLTLQAIGYNVANELADRSIAWKRNRFHQYGNVHTDYAPVAGFPGGKCEFQYYQADWQSCGNTALYELITGSWTYVAGWNFNTDPPDLNIYDIDVTSQGLLRLVSGSNTPFTITSSSMADRTHHWKDDDGEKSTTPSNIEDFAGFFLGWNDDSNAEFGSLTDYHYAVDSVNLLGFRLSDMPAVLGYGGQGVEILDVSFPIPEYNKFWTDMEIILDVASVYAPGNLTVTYPSTGKGETTLVIDHAGFYTIYVGEVPDEALHTVSFDASYCAFTIDAWKLNSLVPLSCCTDPGDANDDGNVNILDVTFSINYLYKGGPAPPCPDQADADASCTLNILDITFLINYLYKGGSAPECGCI